jgi:hypothetical protein
MKGLDPIMTQQYSNTTIAFPNINLPGAFSCACPLTSVPCSNPVGAQGGVCASCTTGDHSGHRQAVGRSTERHTFVFFRALQELRTSFPGLPTSLQFFDLAECYQLRDLLAAALPARTEEGGQHEQEQ